MPATAMERLVGALTEHGCDPRPNGRGGYTALCPAHDDTHPSLDIDAGPDKVLVNCRSRGCTAAAIVEALGLDLRDLFDDDTRRNGHRVRPELVASYPYTNEDGSLLFGVERWQPGFDGKPKSFVQVPASGRRGRGAMSGVRRVLYRLPGVLAAVAAGETVFVCEGEKDADALVEAGYPATTNVGGAGKWRPAYSKTLARAHVVVVADCDAVGYRHAAEVAEALTAHGCEVRVVQAAHGKDASDHLGAGYDVQGLAPVPAELLAPPSTNGDARTGEPASSPSTSSRSGSLRRSSVESALATDAPPQDFTDTDLGNARRMIAEHGIDLRHGADLGCWLAWDGRRWAEDVTGEHVRRATATVDGLFAAVIAETDEQRRKALAKHAVASSSSFRIAGMIRLAETERGVRIRTDELDRDVWSLNVANGTLDLRTGALRTHRREDHHSKLAPVRFDSRATCPKWLRFLADVFDHDDSLIAFIQRSAGYALTGDVSEEVLWLPHGDGLNGKSTLMGTLRSLLGEYACEIDSRMLLASRHDQHPTEIMDLRGMRLVTTRETDRDRHLAEATVKRLVSVEPIRARRMHRDPVQFMPTHKLWFAANYLPVIGGTDLGIWRRIMHVPFTQSFEGARRVRRMDERLADELSGILTWALEGCQAWLADGLQIPPAVEVATTAYRADSDHVGRFLAECCVVDDAHWVTAEDLRNAYEPWCRDNGEQPWSAKALGAELTSRGFVRARCGTGNRWGWRRFGLLTQPTLGDSTLP
jgi:putative DNA primase/helicase